MELDARKMRILQAIIDDYILTASPVGSRSISKRADFNLSSATIRNEMSDLEEMGYLEQPHTSSGRVPSHKAYRLYVNNMMRRAQLTKDEQRMIRSYFTHRMDEIEGIMKQTAAALSEVTRYTAMVLPPQLHAVRLKHIQIVPVAAERALVVMVTDAGLVRDAMIRIPDSMDARHMERLSNMLTERFRDHRLDEITQIDLSQLAEELSVERAFFTSMLDAMERNMQPDAHAVELSGSTNMLAFPEYADMNKAKTFLSAIEGKDTLYHMLKKASTMEFSITIGPENDQEELSDCSVVTATYKVGDDPMGTFGIIGPTRMHYARVLSILEFMRMSLSEALLGIMDDDGKH